MDLICAIVFSPEDWTYTAAPIRCTASENGAFTLKAKELRL